MASDDKKQPPKPGKEQELLQVFVGKWKTEGKCWEHPNGLAIPVRAVDSYEWLPGKFFLIHRWEAKIGGNENKGIEIIGFDEPTGTYFMHSYDNLGNRTVMEASFQNNTWAYLGESERCQVIFKNEGRIMNGSWERTSDGVNWVPWMEVKLTKES
ncbi:MAG TPA: DUF1579 family protein [Chitinophagaceae bacterium]|nr:DUF1579 family protein [Chitinophagaceae bacterium]